MGVHCGRSSSPRLMMKVSGMAGTSCQPSFWYICRPVLVHTSRHLLQLSKHGCNFGQDVCREGRRWPHRQMTGQQLQSVHLASCRSPESSCSPSLCAPQRRICLHRHQIICPPWTTRQQLFDCRDASCTCLLRMRARSDGPCCHRPYTRAMDRLSSRNMPTL